MTELLDLFSGAGGFSLGASWSGYTVTGVELDPDAAAVPDTLLTRTLSADVRELDPHRFIGVDYLHASPPCQTFTKSGGLRKGRQHVEALSAEVARVLSGDYTLLLDLAEADERTLLTLEPARWIAEVQPRAISLEQVPAVLPVWEAYASALAAVGYSTWAGYLDAEQYGTPQARRRAWLIARADGRDARPPRPTHSRYNMRSPHKLDAGVPKWRTMQDALPDLDYVYITAGGIAGEGRPRHVDHPAPTITGKGAAAWLDSVDQYVRPWPHRPADAGRLDHKAGKAPRNVTPAETGALQGMPLDYPFAGKVGAQYRQAGNLVPPQVAAAVTAELRGGR